VPAGDPEVHFTVLVREYRVARAWIASASRPVSQHGSPDRAPTGPEGQGGESGGADGASRRAMRSSPPPNPGSLRAMSFRCRRLAHLRPQGREVRLGRTAKVARPTCRHGSGVAMLAGVLPPSAAAGHKEVRIVLKCRERREVPLRPPGYPPRRSAPRYGATKAGLPNLKLRLPMPSVLASSGALVVRGCWLGDELPQLPSGRREPGRLAIRPDGGRGYRSRAAPLPVGCVVSRLDPRHYRVGWRRPYLPADSASGQWRPAAR